MKQEKTKTKKENKSSVHNKNNFTLDIKKVKETSQNL